MITITKKHAETIKKVCSIASSRNPIAIFENVLLQADNNSLKLTASDSVIECTSTIDCEVKSPFTTTVNAAKFMQSFNACKGDVVVSVKDDMQIKSGRSKFTLPILSGDDYPLFEASKDAESITDDINAILGKVKKVSFASGKDDVRYYLNGVYIGADVVATNGHMAAVISSDVELKSSLIVPISSIPKLPLTANKMVFDSNCLTIQSDNFTFKTKLIDGKFPDYKRIQVQPNHTATVNRFDLIESIKACSITANDFKCVTMSFSDNELTLESGRQKESTIIKLDAKHDNDFVFNVNSDYLINSLSCLSDDLVTIGFSNASMIIDSDVKIIISAVAK